MVKLTRDLINKSPQYRNPLKDREIDLRGNKITILENLGVTQDLFDSMDLSDNDLKKLDGFPILRRLKLLIVCNNHISRISENLGSSLPNLQRLVLINNNIQEVADLIPITKMKSLRSLCLLRNPVANHICYRAFIIYHMPYLRILDAQKVAPLEIDSAAQKFGGINGLKLMKELMEARTRSKIKFDEDDEPNEQNLIHPNTESADAIKVEN
uniref:U2 small nuclear ribonucleoprotein A' (Trinotate prediction) n=1 Tax=Myxobolus squamalis TaxID=59785 RepID=A0A6B2G4A8_MYXSQ